ncbi:MAG: hypothetical protein ACR2F1_00550 [Nitrososphaeraceae archaeon]
MSKPIIEIMNQKFILDLNAALVMENAGIERLQTRIEETSCQKHNNNWNTIWKKV